MNIESIREYCLSLPLATEAFPFDERTLVFRILGKIYNRENDLYKFSKRNVHFPPFFSRFVFQLGISSKRLLIGV